MDHSTTTMTKIFTKAILERKNDLCITILLLVELYDVILGETTVATVFFSKISLKNC